MPKRALLISAAISIAASLLILGFLIDQRSRQLDEVVVAIQPTQNPAEITASAERLERFLEERTGLEVEIYVPTTYSAVIEALRFKNAHVALMGSWPAAMAAKLADAEIVLAEVRTVFIGDELVEAPFYFSYWIVLPDSPYERLEDLRGKRVCFPSPISSSGYLAPVARLVELGLVSREAGPADPREFFGEVIFGGGYGQCWEALKRGRVEVAIIAGDVSAKLYREVLENSRIIEMQGPLPSHALVFSKDLPPDVERRLKEAFLELGLEAHRDMMRDLVSGIFVRFEVTSTEEHIGPLLRFMEITGLTFGR